MSETGADATADAPPAACVPVSGFPDVTGYRRGVFVSLFAVWSQHSSSYQRDTIDTDSITLDRVTPFALSPTTISVVGLWWGWCVNPESTVPGTRYRLKDTGGSRDTHGTHSTGKKTPGGAGTHRALRALGKHARAPTTHDSTR